MNIKATINGVEQEFEVVGGIGYTHTLNNCGIWDNSRVKMEGVRLRLVCKRHTFGRVVFEEIGERRIPVNEWAYHDSHGPSVYYHAEGDTAHEATIVRPVALITEDGYEMGITGTMWYKQ